MQLYYMLAGLMVVMRGQSRCLSDMPGEYTSLQLGSFVTPSHGSVLLPDIPGDFRLV